MSEEVDRELEDLVVRAQGGDEAAFGDLVRRFQRRVFFAVMRVVNDMHLADDLTQDAFVKAHRALPRLQTPGFFGTWLHRIALNVAIDAKKKRQRRRDREVSGGEFGWIEAPTDPALVEVLDDVEALRVATQEAVATLPKGQRVVMEMAMDPEVTQEEIARVLQIPKGTVKSRLFHARKYLFEKLRPFLGGET